MSVHASSPRTCRGHSASRFTSRTSLAPMAPSASRTPPRVRRMATPFLLRPTRSPAIHTYSTTNVDPSKDLLPIIQLSRQPIVLAAHPSLGVNSLAELIALAKKQPGLPYATGSGAGIGAAYGGAMVRADRRHYA